NSPCVIGEALCCGLPVIATDVGGIPELLNKTNGILISPKSNTGLTSTMIQLYQQYSQFDPLVIASSSHPKFSYSSVGSRLRRFYDEYHKP
ncbi:MAG: glycosyltransferase, partial [Bacteroidota bacterium]|nr:glycosyltransferase [Bacteroidota bacterium]